MGEIVYHATNLIIERGIPYYSTCEHHLLSFWGTVTVGYIPGDNLLGLSKIGRVVDYFAHRLQLQERMTQQIASYLDDNLQPIGLGVIATGRHLCMEMRGVKKPGTITITSALKGALYEEQSTREEFLNLARVDG